MSWYTGNVQFEASKVLHENCNHGKTIDSRCVAYHLESLSLTQHSMIRFVCIPHIGTKRKLLTKAGSSNILVHVVATYDTFQAVLGFLCHHVLHLPDIHACVDAFATYNTMVRGYTKNLVVRRTLVIKLIIFCLDHLYAHALNKRVLWYFIMS